MAAAPNTALQDLRQQRLQDRRRRRQPRLRDRLADITAGEFGGAFLDAMPEQAGDLADLDLPRRCALDQGEERTQFLLRRHQRR